MAIDDDRKREYMEEQRKLRAQFLRDQAHRLKTELHVNIGQWMRSDWGPEDCAEELLNLMENSSQEISEVQVALEEELDQLNGERLKMQLNWLLSKSFRMRQIQANVGMLLDIVNFLLWQPRGTMYQCVHKDGTPYYDPKMQPKPTEADPNPAPVPKYELATDEDRKRDIARKIIAYDRFKKEIDNMLEVMTSKHFFGQKCLDDLVAARKSGT